MHSTYAISDIAQVIRRAHDEGAHVGLILGDRKAENEGIRTQLARQGVETRALETIILDYALPDVTPPTKASLSTATQHLVQAKDARLVVLILQTTGNSAYACSVLYAGQPVASVKDVTDAVADGDALDVRHGELWIESPAGSGSWSFAGVVLHDVAVELRKHGVLVAG